MKLTAVVLASIFVIGCSRAPVGRVYVDVQRVAMSDPLQFVASNPSPNPPAAFGGTAHSIPPIQRQRLDFSENEARLKKVRAAVEEAREQTARQIAGKLREAYLREIDAIEDERLLKAGAIRDAALAKAWAQVKSRFLTYANARAPHAIRLALYAGFPDPDPASQRIPPDQNAVKRQFERARDDRNTLADLDQSYDTDARNLLASYSDEVSAQIASIRGELEQMRAEAEARAVRDAAAQVAKLTEAIESVLSGKSEVNLPASPGRTVSIPPTTAVSPAPVIKSDTMAQAEANRLKAVRSDLQIWCAHFGVELVDSPRSGQDRTDEFIVWRKQRQLGP